MAMSIDQRLEAVTMNLELAMHADDSMRERIKAQADRIDGVLRIAELHQVQFEQHQRSIEQNSGQIRALTRSVEQNGVYIRALAGFIESHHGRIERLEGETGR